MGRRWLPTGDKMRVLLDDILTTNSTLIRSWITDIRPNDTASIMRTRLGDRIVFAEDDQITEDLSILVRPRMMLVVTKGADAGEILTLLNSVANGLVQSIGTHMTSDLTAVPKLLSAGADVLARIRNQVTSSDNVAFTIPVKDIASNVTLQMTATVSGWTRTTDYEPEDFAEFSYTAKIDTTPSPTNTSRNQSTQKLLKIDPAEVKVSKDMADSEALCLLDMGWALGTNGAFTHDTASMVQVSHFTINLRYV